MLLEISSEIIFEMAFSKAFFNKGKTCDIIFVIAKTLSYWLIY